MKIIYSVLCIALICYNLNAQSSQTYTGKHNEQEFSIEVPNTWELNTESEQGPLFIIFTPSDDSNDRFSDNINLVIQDVRGTNVDLQYYVEYSRTQIQKMIEGFEIIGEEYQEIADLPSYSFEYFGTQNGMKIKFRQHFWLIDEIAYVLTLTIENSKLDFHEKSMKAIMDTFKFE